MNQFQFAGIFPINRSIASLEIKSHLLKNSEQSCDIKLVEMDSDSDSCSKLTIDVSDTSSIPGNKKMIADAYLKKWQSLVRFEEASYSEEDFKLMKTPIKKLLDKGEGLTNIKFHRMRFESGRLAIELKLPNKKDLGNFFLKIDDFITVLDNGPKNQYLILDKEVKIVSGLVKEYNPAQRCLIFIPTQSVEKDQLQNHLSTNELTVLKRPNTLIFPKINRILKTLKTILETEEHPQKEFFQALIDENPQSFPKPLKIHDDLDWRNKNINKEQRLAVLEAIAANKAYVLQGPPGTGKTTVLEELIYQMNKLGKKLLVCATSHIATDNIAERFVKSGIPIARLGDMGKVSNNVNPYTIEYVVKNDPLYQKLSISLEELREKLKYNKTRTIETQIEELEIRCKIQESKIANDFIKSADIVFSTINGARDRFMEDYLQQPKVQYFDCVIIDECAQSPEVFCWTYSSRNESNYCWRSHATISLT